MTTNLTPIEALKQIKEICKKSKQLTCTNNGCCQVSTCEEIEKITDQALAPQECKEEKILNDIYKMGVESLDPESFESLCRVLDILANTRKIEWRSNYDN